MRRASVSRTGRPLVAFMVATLLVAACSDASDDSAADPTSSGPTTVVDATAPSTTVVPSTTVAPTTSTSSTTTTTTIPSPTGGVYPGAEWAVGDLPASVDRAALDAAVDAAFGAPDAAGRVRSIVAVRGGEIVYERYHPLDGPDTVMDSYSVAKSVTSAVIGLLVGDGLLDVDAPAPVAAWSDPADPRHAITLEHLLHMASGLEWAEEYGEGSAVRRMFTSERASDIPAEAPLVAVPGESFEYSTGTTAILAGIAIDTLGGPEAFDEYVHERLLDPLGITSMELVTDQGGLLYLNDGVWDGQRILPEGWVEYSHTPSPANPQYGAQWWMFRPGAFEARGLFGQVILVSRDHDLVLAFNTTQGGEVDPLVGAAYDLFAAA
jgi:CubicO group peptidase (beta-lactamase class C family)